MTTTIMVINNFMLSQAFLWDFSIICVSTPPKIIVGYLELKIVRLKKDEFKFVFKVFIRPKEDL